MGRKDQARHTKQQTKSKQVSNLNKNQRELQILIDKLLRLTAQPPQQNALKELEVIKEIYPVIDKIKNLEVDIDGKFSIAKKHRCNRATLERFTTWLTENSAKFEGTSITEFAGYDLGLKAEIDIPEASLIIAIPRQIMMTVDAAKKSLLGPLVTSDTVLQNMPNVSLAMFLLFEKFRESSFWKPYIDILPAFYSTVLYFDMDDLEDLVGSPTLKSALSQIKSIARQYAYFYKIIWLSDSMVCDILKKRFTYREYCWAVSTIMTRQNTIPSEDGRNFINALIPLWDLCNHTNGNISTDYNPELDRSECLAVRDFKAGEQLFIFYGKRTNADLFIHNGFVYEENEHDSYDLNLGISQSDPMREERINLLQRLNICPSTSFKLRNGPQPIDEDLLAFLRIFNMNEDQLGHWTSSGKADDLKFADCALETSLEKKTWTFLQTRINLLLAAYKTTLDEDLKLISEETSNNKILAIRMRSTEKRILRCVLDYVEQYIKQ